MVPNAEGPIRIDLSSFKLHVCLKPGRAFTLHFNTPSRRFYLSLIAFLVSRMKRSGQITSVALEEHLDLLALLNETVGESAGSSGRENLLGRVYRKWRSALPDLENTPLFRVLARTRAGETGGGKPPSFTEAERDLWANLFEYAGSEDHVRLRFSIDRIGLGLDDVRIAWEGHSDLEAWERFVSALRSTQPAQPEAERLPGVVPPDSTPEPEVQPGAAWKRLPGRRVAWAVGLLLFAVGAALTAWKMSRLPPSGVASTPTRLRPLPDRPSIAVLPFTNLSGDPEQDYIGDGLTEHIITALSKIPDMVVIARNSTFTYKGRPVRPQEVSRDLGVRHVLEGSVQKSGDQIRVTTQLIDASTGHHTWSDYYDRHLEDLFSVQDDITLNIVVALSVQLTEGEQAAVRHRTTQNLQAWGFSVRGYGLVQRNTREDNARGQELLQKAVAIDPQYAWAWTWLGWSHWFAARWGYSDDREASLGKSVEMVRKALDLDANEPDAHALQGAVHLFRKEYDQAIAAGRRAITLGPSNAENHALMGVFMKYAGRHLEAIEYSEKAMRLQPYYPTWYLFNVALPYFWMKKPAESIPRFLEIIERQKDIGGPHLMWAEVFVTSAYGHLGLEKDARAHLVNVMRLVPEASVNHFERLGQEQAFLKDRAARSYLHDGLRKAGLREGE